MRDLVYNVNWEGHVIHNVYSNKSEQLLYRAVAMDC